MLRFKYSNRTDLKYSTNAENTQSFTLNNDSANESRTIDVPDVLFDDLLINTTDKILYSHGVIIGEKQDLSELVTKEEFSYIEEAYKNHIVKGTLATINGESLEDTSNISIDMSLYKIVTELPTENILDNKIYIIATPKENNETEFAEYVWTDTKWDQLGVYSQKVDLSSYLKTEDADKKYMKLSNGAVSLAISDKNGLANYSNNGQAFNAIRDCGTNSLTGKALNAGAFGVKLDGTTAFTHKTYDSFNAATGAAGGARNTAVLTFSGATGLRYAKNTGTSADVTDAMYKYVGVIDSPDEKQKVYSAAQVDAIIKGLQNQIDELKQQIDQLTN